tara:strand:+ start:1064 stop:1168 length:105 start_codon:yes stop_codon:yes gene_type:complete
MIILQNCEYLKIIGVEKVGFYQGKYIKNHARRNI